MSLVVNTNVASLNAQRSLSSSGAELKTAMERLSSGKKINSAADDAAGFAIAERMTAQIRGLNMATKNANDGLSMLAVIENATNDVTDMLQRMRELAIQAANDTNGSADRGFLQSEVSQLIQEIDRVATQTQYNGETILNGSFTDKKIQVGTEAGQTVNFSVNSIAKDDLGAHYVHWDTVGSADNVARVTGTNNVAITTTTDLSGTVSVGDQLAVGGWGDFDVVEVSATTITIADEHGDSITEFANHADSNGQINVHTVDSGFHSIAGIDVSNNPTEGLSVITSAIEQVASQRATHGALQNRLEYTVSNLMNVAEFTTSARSRIEDADFAAESARLAKAQVLQQTGAAMLAQANAAPQLVLGLIA